jgi:hypothetical protein
VRDARATPTASMIGRMTRCGDACGVHRVDMGRVAHLARPRGAMGAASEERKWVWVLAQRRFARARQDRLKAWLSVCGWWLVGWVVGGCGGAAAEADVCGNDLLNLATHANLLLLSRPDADRRMHGAGLSTTPRMCETEERRMVPGSNAQNVTRLAEAAKKRF